MAPIREGHSTTGNRASLPDLSDDAIDTMIACFARCPTPMGQLLLEHVHGAAARIGVGDTAFPHRAEGYNFLVLSQWTDAADTDACIAWARETYAEMQPFVALRPVRELPG